MQKLTKYGSLINVQVMAAVAVNDGASSADAELTMYLEMAWDFINESLNGLLLCHFLF